MYFFFLFSVNIMNFNMCAMSYDRLKFYQYYYYRYLTIAIVLNSIIS